MKPLLMFFDRHCVIFALFAYRGVATNNSVDLLPVFIFVYAISLERLYRKNEYCEWRVTVLDDLLTFRTTGRQGISRVSPM